MSVVSSRVSSVSSIIKATGIRSQLNKQSSRIHYFKLPKDIKSILCNFKAGNGIKEYEKLIHALKEDAIQVKINKKFVKCMQIIFYNFLMCDEHISYALCKTWSIAYYDVR